MKYLTKDLILAADDIQFADVDVPEWGGSVRVRSLSGRQRSELIRDTPDDGARDWIERLVAAAVCDENGQPLFTADDIAGLGRKNAAALNRIFEAADDLNQFSERAQGELKGESEPTPK